MHAKKAERGMTMDSCNFNCEHPGENCYAIKEQGSEGLREGQQLTINGNSDLSGIIQFNDNGCVFGIRLVSNPGLYDYKLDVDARGPKGFGSGNGYLEFTDASGDKYSLKIYSSTRSEHTLCYNSKEPNIVKVEWNNHSI